MKNRLWMIFWLAIGSLFVIAGAAAGGGVSALSAMVCGFMVAQSALALPELPDDGTSEKR